MIKQRITYVKRCLNQRCKRKEQCEHGRAMQRFKQLFPKGMEEIPMNMQEQFRAIFPVAFSCHRWKLNREQCIELQNQTKQ